MTMLFLTLGSKCIYSDTSGLAENRGLILLKDLELNLIDDPPGARLTLYDLTAKTWHGIMKTLRLRDPEREHLSQTFPCF